MLTMTSLVVATENKSKLKGHLSAPLEAMYYFNNRNRQTEIFRLFSLFLRFLVIQLLPKIKYRARYYGDRIRLQRNMNGSIKYVSKLIYRRKKKNEKTSVHSKMPEG